MYIIGKVAAAAVLCAGTSAQEFVLTGGVPPAPANPKDCDIAGLFNHIETVTTSEVCRAGCNGGACTGPPEAPDEWYPDHEDECNEECGLVYETFWDECGKMLDDMGMGGMEEMGAFYDNCLETLYPPGKCGLFCNEHTYECMLAEVQESCCDEGGDNCVAEKDVPLTCPVGCALVFPEFTEICHDHIEAVGVEAGMDPINDYIAFSEECLSVDGLALVEYALELKARGCTINLAGASGMGGGVGGGGGGVFGRRSLQSHLLEQWLDSEDNHCIWEEVDDLANAVDMVCCGVDGAGCMLGTDGNFMPPATCNPTCFIALHEVLAQCEPVISHILGPSRWAIVSSFKDKCIAEVDTEIFMHAIELAVCPDPVTGIMPPPPPAHDPLPDLFGGEPSPTPAPAPNPFVVAPTPAPAIPGMGKVTPIAPDGVKHQEEIDVGGEVEVFSFVAKAGESYEMDSDLETLPDSVMELLDVDGKTILVENDDDPRVTDLYDSYIEWTCPKDGTYFINVHEYGRDTGTFALTITTAKEGLFGIGGAAGGDPCGGGAKMTEDNAIISFQPDGNYDDDAECKWTIECEAEGTVAILEFDEFETESDYDYVKVYDGGSIADSVLSVGVSGEISGDMADLPAADRTFQSSEGSMTIEFVSDESLNKGGFEAAYRCGAPGSTSGGR